MFLNLLLVIIVFLVCGESLVTHLIWIFKLLIYIYTYEINQNIDKSENIKLDEKSEKCIIYRVA